MNEQLYHPIKTTLHWKDRSSASDPTIRQTKDKDQTCRKKKRNAGDLQEAEHHKLTDAEARREEEAQNMKGGNLETAERRRAIRRGIREQMRPDYAVLSCCLWIQTGRRGRAAFIERVKGIRGVCLEGFFFTACHYFLPFLIYRFIGRPVSFCNFLPLLYCHFPK